MPPRDTDCPRCRGRLEPGFFPEFDQSQPSPISWVPGDAPEKKWYGKSIKGRTRYGVEVYRCRECGRLELYAPTVEKE